MAKAKDEPGSVRNGDSKTLLFELTSDESGEPQPGSLSVLVFEVGEEMFAIGVDHTEGVVDCPRVAPLPSPPEGMVGVTSVRGRMTLVLAPESGAGLKAGKRRLILLKGDAHLGLIVDRVEGVVSLAPAGDRKGKPRQTADASSLKDGRSGAWPVLSSFKRGKSTVRIIDVERLVED
jgi:chemotaxis signal transduction protein